MLRPTFRIKACRKHAEGPWLNNNDSVAELMTSRSLFAARFNAPPKCQNDVTSHSLVDWECSHGGLQEVKIKTIE